jgi:hypothetical protein
MFHVHWTCCYSCFVVGYVFLWLLILLADILQARGIEGMHCNMWRLVPWSKHSHSWDSLLWALDSVWHSRNPWHSCNPPKSDVRVSRWAMFLGLKFGMAWFERRDIFMTEDLGTLDFCICTLFSQWWGICPQKQIWSFNMPKSVQYTLIFILEFLYAW